MLDNEVDTQIVTVILTDMIQNFCSPRFPYYDVHKANNLLPATLCVFDQAACSVNGC